MTTAAVRPGGLGGLARLGRRAFPGGSRALLSAPAFAWVLVFLVPALWLMVNESLDAGGDAYSTAVFSDVFFETWLRSLRLAAVQTVIVLAFVCPYVYALVFHVTSTRWRLALLALTMAPFFLSYVIQVYTWSVILAPNGVINWATGGATELLRTELGLHLALLAIIWPIATLLLFLSMSSVRGDLVEVASNLGASRRRILRDVVVPVSRPGIMLAGMLTFVLTFSDSLAFTTLGGVQGVGSALQSYVQNDGDTSAASAIAVVMILTILVVVIASLMLGGAQLRIGKTTALPKTGPSWPWRIYIAVGLAFVSLPVLIDILLSFSASQIPAWPIDNWTADWYSALSDDEAMKTALRNSLTVGIIVGAAATAVVAAAAYYLHNYRPRWMSSYILVLVLPAIAPPAVLGLGLQLYFVELGIWGDLWSVGLAYVAMYAVFCLFIIMNRLNSVDPHLEEAATNLGARRPRAVRDAYLPAARVALVASLVVAAGLSMGESSVSQYLTATTYTWPSYVVNIITFNVSPQIFASGAVVYVAILVALVTILIGRVVVSGVAERWRTIRSERNVARPAPDTLSHEVPG